MRELWRATTLIAQNDGGILDQLKAIANTQPNPNLLDNVQFHADPDFPKLQVKAQPPIPTLKEIYKLFKDRDIFLCAYELSEINRWVRRDVETGGQRLRGLIEYWDKLKVIAGGGGSRGFQEAVGAMSFDNELRRQVKLGGKLKSDFGFNVTPAEEAALSAAVSNAGVENAAARFFADTWTGSSCGAVSAVANNWIHFNL